MVSRSKKANPGKKEKLKVLNLERETVRNLTEGESKRVKGGRAAPTLQTLNCHTANSRTSCAIKLK